jgi:predicted RNase H-like HicB family nuclease
MKYAIMIEQGEENLSAYVPDIPGCVATGKTTEELQNNIRDAIRLHIEAMKEEGLPVPQPSTHCAYVEA